MRLQFKATDADTAKTVNDPGDTPVTKLDRLIALLRRPEGADMPTMIAATDWQAHSIRGAMAGALKKKGHAAVSEKIDGRRVWRITCKDAGQ